MSSDRICFNPDLISTDPNYAGDIDSLTTENFVSPDDPCVPLDDVPASFIASGLDPVVKDWLIDLWALRFGEHVPSDPLTQNWMPANTKQLVRARRESVLGAGASRPTQEHAIRDLGFVSVYLRSELIDRLARDESNLDFLIELATRRGLSQEIRAQIVSAMRATPGTRVDDFLLHAMQNLDVKEYAGEALKARAQNPNFAGHANEVLRASLAPSAHK